MNWSRVFLRGVAVWCLYVNVQAAEPTVRDTMSGVYARLVGAVSQEELLKLDQASAQRFVTPADRGVLATQYWHFEANLPVVVSVMRDMKQAEMPFWLAEAGFRKCGLSVATENYHYEVWQKRFPAGRIGLGINGFIKHRPHYFVCVGPEQPGARLKLKRVFPADPPPMAMRVGSFVYSDWPDLVLTNVPGALEGHILLPTYRGRAREAQLIDAFRKTPFPSSDRPDQVMLTLTESPRTSQALQWRNGPSGLTGIVRYREKHAGAEVAWKERRAARETIQDQALINDPRVNRFSAVLRGLKPATTYVYAVGGARDDSRSLEFEFTTAPAEDAPFKFIFLSDTHNSPVSGKLLARALERHPDAAFCTISGDLVGTGQHRDDWDQLFKYTEAFSRLRPIMPAIGNHDTIDGLGPGLYLSLFALPRNGPRRLEPERAYTFEYGNALFVVLDATASVENQRAWLDAQLARTRATWKFAIFHFPPYGPEVEYTDILREWCTLFDKHHVDFVLSGHVHDFIRTHPIRAGQRVGSPCDGTIYLVTVAVPSREVKMAKPDHAAVAEHTGDALYQVFSINGNKLVTQSCNLEGKICDERVITKDTNTGVNVGGKP